MSKTIFYLRKATVKDLLNCGQTKLFAKRFLKEEHLYGNFTLITKNIRIWLPAHIQRNEDMFGEIVGTLYHENLHKAISEVTGKCNVGLEEEIVKGIVRL